MFTGIIETTAKVVAVSHQGSNMDLTFESNIASELSVDQSVSHNGVCLTVTRCSVNQYSVTAIQETLDKSNIGHLELGALVNLERAMKLGDRLDGHIVQGHVDQKGRCSKIEEKDGSWIFSFEYDESQGNLTIEKGSITVNGVSLTVINSKPGAFGVAIIPYTYEHTNFKSLAQGDEVNLEFDVVGKYLKRLSQEYF